MKVYPVRDVVSIQFDNPSLLKQQSQDGPNSGVSSSVPTPSEPAPPSTPDDVADKQRKFCAVISDYRDANTCYANEPNPMKYADMRKSDPYDFEQCIVDLLGESGRFDKWTGTVRFHVDGNHTGASFFPDCKGFPQAIEYGNLGNFQTGQKGERQQRYKNAPNYPPASAASPRYLAAFDSKTLQH